MNQVYKAAGITKQAVAQRAKKQAIFEDNVKSLILEVDELRAAIPGCGVEKMYDTLSPDFIGRDRFVELFMELGYRLKRKRNYRRTTYSSNIYYPNLINGITINEPSMIWQSDITYYRVNDRFYYLVFIIDVYTRKIVGFNVSDNMRATANLKALKMALSQHKAPKFHHSDRGSQYIYKEYINTLQQTGTQISMGLTAQDNAYAERINRTIKEEFLDYWKPIDFNQLKRMTIKAVNNYNNLRTHRNLGKNTPNKFEEIWNKTSSQQRPLLTIFNNELIT